MDLFLTPVGAKKELKICRECTEFIDEIFNLDGIDYYACTNDDCSYSLALSPLREYNYFGLTYNCLQRTIGKKTSNHKHITWDSKLKKWVVKCYIRSLKKYKTFGYYENETDAKSIGVESIYKQYPEVIEYA